MRFFLMNILIQVRACRRLIGLAWHIGRGFFTLLWRFPRWSEAQKKQAIQAWALDLLGHTAIELDICGDPPQTQATLLAANHVSWLDVYVILACCPCRFVAKSEVRRWPLVGTLAAASGTLFITRQSPRDAVRVVHQMVARLRQGDTLAIFPEGTTSNGLQILPFHANLFQAAIVANVPVQAVALRYLDAATQDPSLAPCYIDDDTLLGAIWRTLSAPRIRATIHFDAPIHAQGCTRRDLACAAKDRVSQLL